MGWSFRKSRNFGPFRINLSRRGVGWSIGRGGLRLGSGARGPYVSASKFGFNYRKNLAAGAKAGQPTHPGAAAPGTGFFALVWRLIKWGVLLLLIILSTLWLIGFLSRH
jgi:hypothetical protein